MEFNYNRLDQYKPALDDGFKYTFHNNSKNYHLYIFKSRTEYVLTEENYPDKKIVFLIVKRNFEDFKREVKEYFEKNRGEN